MLVAWWEWHSAKRTRCNLIVSRNVEEIFMGLRKVWGSFWEISLENKSWALGRNSVRRPTDEVDDVRTKRIQTVLLYNFWDIMNTALPTNYLDNMMSQRPSLIFSLTPIVDSLHEVEFASSRTILGNSDKAPASTWTLQLAEVACY